MSKATLADDCTTVLRLLADAPPEGLSQDEIAAATGWSLRTVNGVLCDLIGKVKGEKVHAGRGGRVTKYTLKAST